MIKKLLILVFIVSNSITAQNTVGTISITNDALEAYTLFSSHTKTYLINNCGEVINEWNSAFTTGHAVYLLPNGNLLRAGLQAGSNLSIPGVGGVIELFDWDGNVIWTYSYNTNDFKQHHDVYPLPNGNILILAITPITQAEVIQAGRDPNSFVGSVIYNEQIVEVEPVGTNGANIVWEWNIKDHLIQDFDNTKDNFGVVADNPQRLDINFLNGQTPQRNWLHCNSIQYNAKRDQIVISSRHMSEIYIIDHSTTTAEAATGSGGTYGKGGDFLYRWGNPEAYDQGTSADRMLYGQHTPYFIEDGLPNANKIMVFNNGFDRSPSFSQVDIITPPESALGVYDYTPGTAYAPSVTDYTYTGDLSTDPSDFYTPVFSNGQQLSNGNILVCEGFDGYIFELDPNDNKVWEYIIPIDRITGDIFQQFDTPLGNGTFRATKYPTDYAAFSGRDVTPGAPIEGNPDLTPCNTLSTSEVEQFNVTLYPNPTKGSVEITSRTPIDKVEVYNILGHKILTTYGAKIDLSNQSSGVYVLSIYTNSRRIHKKVLKD